MMRSSPPIILASASPRRSRLLARLGLPFQVCAADIDETIDAGEKPAQAVCRLALAKARVVAAGRGTGLVIGADTVVVLDGVILGKPASAAAARVMLAGLSGREHDVITGVAVVDAAGGEGLVDHEVTRVRFRDLAMPEIDAYVATGESLDKAGAYGIQGLGAVLVQGISGCYFNVVGLPLARLYLMLRHFGVEVL